MTRGILGRFFDWTFGSLCADAELRKAEEAGKRARMRKEIEKAVKKNDAKVERRRKAEAARERAEEQLQEEIKRVRSEKIHEIERRLNKISEKKYAVIEEVVNDPNRNLGRDPEFRQLELDYDRTAAEIEAKYAQKLEIIRESGERKRQDLQEKYFATLY